MNFCVADKNINFNENSLIKYDVVSCSEKHSENISISNLYSSGKIEICMIISGDGIHQVFNQKFPCKKDDIFIIPPDTPHGLFLSEDSAELVAHRLLFDAREFLSKEIATTGNRRFCYGVFSDDAVAAYAKLNAETLSEVGSLFDKIIVESNQQSFEWKESVSAYIRLLLITIGRYVNSAIQNKSLLTSKEKHIVSSVIKTVKYEFSNSNLTLESISKTLFISKAHLSRVFARVTGETFFEYLRTVRLNHACKLLRETDMKVEEIARACGIKDVPTFYRVFSEYTRMTPRAYRKGGLIDINAKDPFLVDEISSGVHSGKIDRVCELVQRAMELGVPAEKILNEGLINGMNLVGMQFKNNEIFIPEVLIASKAMNKGAELLKPLLTKEKVKSKGKALIGTVRGDLHDIGKNLVKMMLEGKGFEVIDLGTDVAASDFIDIAIKENCRIVCCSALLTTTMPELKNVIDYATKIGVRPKLKLMVGGAPVTQEYADSIGADAYASDAATAAEIALEFTNNF